MTVPALALEQVDKRFPGVHALKSVSIEVRPHEVVGLVGENGAGKSTLMRILAGVYQPDAGRILLAGQPVTLRSATDAARHGIGMVFQEQSLLTNLSVGENIWLGNEGRFTRTGLVRWSELFAAAGRQLAKVGLADLDPRQRAGELDFATRQMVELAKALTLEEGAQGHLVILLDEPTSVLERADIDILFERVRALKARASFVFVSHRLDEVLELSDRVYVMKDGAVVADLPAADADVHMLHRLMVGRGLQAEYYREPLQRPCREEILVEARGLGLRGAYRDVDFTLHAGEILGIAGVIGSGREELSRTLAGFAPHDAGTLTLHGRDVVLASPADAVDHGIGYVPRERRTEGLVLFLPVAANITLASLGELRRFGLIDTRAERRLASEWVERLRIRTPGHRHALSDALRRQPAEGGARQVAECPLEDPDPGPPDPRPGRGRQGGGLRAGARGHHRRHGRDPDLRHAGGDDRPQPSRPGHARRRGHLRHRRRARAQAPAGRSDRAHGVSP